MKNQKRNLMLLLLLSMIGITSDSEAMLRGTSWLMRKYKVPFIANHCRANLKMPVKRILYGKTILSGIVIYEYLRDLDYKIVCQYRLIDDVYNQINQQKSLKNEKRLQFLLKLQLQREHELKVLLECRENVLQYNDIE